ncbi:unnamed protein product [Pocillopora meandrina]|uniref:Uncharacterized protein n=1 Tax=Pocillopora meandrina TaxID=46732 RepID=A0AAU9WI03_9CNID|nr:unnamed protein product [Pocillopora meandrina]
MYTRIENTVFSKSAFQLCFLKKNPFFLDQSHNEVWLNKSNLAALRYSVGNCSNKVIVVITLVFFLSSHWLIISIHHMKTMEIELFSAAFFVSHFKMTHSVLAWVARAAFFIVMILQYISFASYPARYENQNGWYALLLLCIPSLILWFLVVCNEKLITWVFSVWGLYIWLALVPIIGVIFGRIKEKIEKDLFFGPDVLTMTLCLTPLLLLLLLNTFEIESKGRELVLKLAFQITLDLFDGIEMLQVILEESEVSIPRSFENAIIAFVCISFMLSHFQLEENRFLDTSIYKYLAVIRITLQILLGNCVFLGLRLALFLKFKRNASIFIAKMAF